VDGELLGDAGFDVTPGAYGMPTAVEAPIGSGPVRVIVCAEYDALPGIGHACGHNVIAAAAVGAGLGLAGLADDLGLTVTVLGTPAEENGGGKVLMLERGAFADADAAMMVHPAPAEAGRMQCLAVCQLDVRYHGKAAHASAYPELGVNAADAVTVAQVGIGLLRQHILPTDRIHGIVTDGGVAANVVPTGPVGAGWFARPHRSD
jgi:amidohydrolase